jgi:CubicO group peptidase (beta-lactamase class C family)
MKKKILKVLKWIGLSLLSIIIVLIIFLTITRNKPLNQEYIEDVIADTQTLFNIQAISIQVMDSDEVLYKAIDGIRVDGTENYVTESDYFHIGSCSKSILAVIAAKQVEAGIIQWNKPFFEVFPELKEVANIAYYNITLSDLLKCRAGLQAFTSGLEIYPKEVLDAQNPEEAFLHYLLTSDPSTDQNEKGEFEYLYSNASYAVACAMIKKVTGKTYEELINTYIYKELDIDARIGWPYEIDENQPYGHMVTSNGLLQIIGPEVEYSLNPLIIPAGDLSMTPEDFTKYIQLHLRGLEGISDFLSQETFEYIDIGEAPQTAKQGEYFSLGSWSGKRLGKNYVAFDGTAGTFYARGVIIPESDYGFAIMANNGNPNAVEYITMRLMKAKYNCWWMFWI